MVNNIQELRAAVEGVKVRSAWMKGVKTYALELIDSVAENYVEYCVNEAIKDRDVKEFERYMLNGADNWKQYSEGGCSLCYDGDIAERLCTKSEVKSLRYKEGGYKEPNPRENWLECQARALGQAARMVIEKII